MAHLPGSEIIRVTQLKCISLGNELVVGAAPKNGIYVWQQCSIVRSGNNVL